MREHKYKVWDKREKRMLSVNAIDFKNKRFLEVEDEDSRSAIILPEGRFDEDFVLIDFTGRCDKNGQEIYQDDFVTGHELPKKDPFLIRWDDDICGFRFPLSYSEKDLEKVGNRWQNPELLAQEKDK